MDITTFLAQIWGPVILAVAVGVFMNRSYYTRVYRDLEKSSLAVLVFGMVAMVFGIIQISLHNLWETTPQIVISFLGWALLVKGALFLVAPKFVDRAGDNWAKLKLIPVAGTLMLVAGGYLTYLGYFV